MTAVNDILNTRGTSPRVFRNMLAFVAPDQDTLLSLQTEVRRLIAWQSIITDAEELNLDGNQSREAQSNLNRCNDTVELRLKETYSWLLVPFIDQYGDMKITYGTGASLLLNTGDRFIESRNGLLTKSPGVRH